MESTQVLNNKQNRCVDRLIHVLLRIARNLVYEQLQKVEKGKMTHRKTEIHKRHKAATELEKQSLQVLQYQENVWRIDNKGNQYTLEILRKECSCQLYCSICKACIHMQRFPQDFCEALTIDHTH